MNSGTQLSARSERIALREGGKGVEMRETSNEVVVSIFGMEENSRTDKQIGGSKKLESGSPYFSNNIPIGSSSISKNTPIGSPTAGLRETESLKTSSSSLEITNSSPTRHRPPIILVGSVTQRRSISRSAYSKPKSRLVEQSYPINSHFVEESSQFVSSCSTSSPTRRTNVGTPKENVKTDPVTPKTQLMASQGGEDEDEDDDDFNKTTNLKLDEKSGKRLKSMVLLERIVFLLLTGILICS